ncbi:hypothetical protein [Rhizobium sp. FKY42]|uniref:hypothetical protein n=1 Tax=Rhizobium sp. FKY42 TaxID=2562310 RepID=UPI0010C0F36E|nr:hypothetical protein [Rhizobium sp. FKY42]
MYEFLVLDAVYGTLREGQPTQTATAYVRDQLQQALNTSPEVFITNETFGVDPCVHFGKQFAAVVSVNGRLQFFAAAEGQAIDFRYYDGVLTPPLDQNS